MGRGGEGGGAFPFLLNSEDDDNLRWIRCITSLYYLVVYLLSSLTYLKSLLLHPADTEECGYIASWQKPTGWGNSQRYMHKLEFSWFDGKHFICK